MNQKIEAIINTLGKEKEEDRFYVYALCDRRNHKPFYIGKGQGDRMWQHEEGFEKEKKYIKNPIEIKDLSEKYKKINELGDNIERIIVKWGLTENEAFMAESALINILNYSEVTLTNIANGHASQKEKNNSICDTKAMNVDSFYENRCKSPVFFEKIKEKSVFICINSLYKECLEMSIDKQAWAIKEAARGCWHIAKERQKSEKTPNYLFAVYQSKICGIYKIKDLKSCSDLKNFPKFPREIRQKEKKAFEAVLNDKNCDSFRHLSAKTKECIDNFNDVIDHKIDEKSYERWLQKSYFICDECDDKEFNKMLGSIIQKEDGSSIFGQNPLRYNYKA